MYGTVRSLFFPVLEYHCGTAQHENYLVHHLHRAVDRSTSAVGMANVCMLCVDVGSRGRGRGRRSIPNQTSS